jgi:hypothetical protein
MATPGLIVGYLSGWMLWSAVVRAGLGAWCGGRPLDAAVSASILGSALLPVFALVLTAHYTTWMTPALLEALSLATPALIALFVVRQLRAHAERYDAARTAKDLERRRPKRGRRPEREGPFLDVEGDDLRTR